MIFFYQFVISLIYFYRCKIPPCTGSAFCVHNRKKYGCKECKAKKAEASAIQAADSMTFLGSLSSDVMMDNCSEQAFANKTSSFNDSIFTQTSTQKTPSQVVGNLLMTPPFSLTATSISSE